MNRVEQRLNLVNDLNDVSDGELSNMAERLTNYWVEAFTNYGGLNISNFKDAEKVGEIVVNGSDSSLIFPRLKANWENGITNKTSCYVITVDGIVVKIGALKSGVKSASFFQYLSGVAGSPSRRSAVVYSFILAMLKNGYQVEVYHVTMDSMANVNIPTINGIVTTTIHYSQFDIEKQNLEVYKKVSNGHVPLLNFKERNATVPSEFDAIYDVIHKRTSKNKKYTYVLDFVNANVESS